jgi:hypothetical protein
MTPVYQTIVDPGKGNCLQAVVASLLDLHLDDVPHFISFEDKWFEAYFNFLEEKGIEYHGCIENPRQLGYCGEDRYGLIKELPGINGFFEATVYSPNYFNGEDYLKGGRVVHHAVIIDRDFKIVHDPNPAYKDLINYPLAERLQYNGVVYFYDLQQKQ